MASILDTQFHALFFNLTNSCNIKSLCHSQPRASAFHLHFDEFGTFGQLLVPQSQTIVTQDEPLQLVHFSQLVHGKVAQLIVHQKEPLQRRQIPEYAMWQLAKIVVAHLESFQMWQTAEAAHWQA